MTAIPIIISVMTPAICLSICLQLSTWPLYEQTVAEVTSTLLSLLSANEYIAEINNTHDTFRPKKFTYDYHCFLSFENMFYLFNVNDRRCRPNQKKVYKRPGGSALGQEGHVPPDSLVVPRFKS